MLRDGQSSGHLAASPDELPDDCPMPDVLAQWIAPLSGGSAEYADQQATDATRVPRRYEGADAWEPGRPLWHYGRGGYLRRLFDVLPAFPPEFRRGKWWCHACDVTWLDAKAEPKVDLSDCEDEAAIRERIDSVEAWSPCWLCGEPAAHWDMPEETERRKRELRDFGRC